MGAAAGWADMGLLALAALPGARFLQRMHSRTLSE
jgi:hypothetical protein